MAETVRKYLDSRPKEEIQQKIYGGMVEHFSTVQRFPLDRITSAADEIHALKRLQSPKNKIAVAVGLAVLVIGTYYSGDLLDVFQPQKKAPPPDQAAIYHDQVIAAMNTIVQAREFPSIVTDGFLPFVEKMPAEIAGWKLQTIV
ncbi:hypothetical protein ACHMW6_00330 (plasmid) [Pseudoduganella sp. UC29_106]|uniref:hypothetical protein n=1 Tax=Pseudoduganella sp. UC29_106 TaxID=3374553 RepID=UPI003757236C